MGALNGLTTATRHARTALIAKGTPARRTKRDGSTGPDPPPIGRRDPLRQITLPAAATRQDRGTRTAFRSAAGNIADDRRLAKPAILRTIDLPAAT